ncbi:GMC family oxidoreductase [Bartonella sp. LJL80]
MENYDADVIVIGSGIIGSNSANLLARAGKSVLILEAGPRVPRWKILQNFRSSGNVYSNGGNRNDPYPSEKWAPTSYEEGYIVNTGPQVYLPGQLRLVGGTTWHWGGACWRNLPNDFKMKSTYGVGRDWPISYDDLEPYYHMAEMELGVSGDSEEDYSGHGRGTYPPRKQPFPIPPQVYSYSSQTIKDKLAQHGYPFTYQPNGRATVPYEERPACVGNNNCSPICPIGSQYSGDRHATKAEQAGAKIIENARAYKLEKGEGGKISAVHYFSPDGKSTRLTAKYFVVAAHTLETARLLLLSDVANSSDMVGRNLMDNNGHGLVFFAKDPLWPGRGPVQQGDIMKWRDGEFRKQRSAIRHEIGNYVSNPAVTDWLLKQGIVGQELDEKIRHYSARTVEISSNFELLPHPENRMTLNSKSKDMFGLPQMSIHFAVDDYVRAGAEVALQDYRTFLKIFEGDVFSLTDDVWENRDHPAGCLIMGDDPKDSVVNSEGRTFDHDNLFLSTTGIMPSVGVNNPTMTGVALALRSAEIIAREV